MRTVRGESRAGGRASVACAFAALGVVTEGWRIVAMRSFAPFVVLVPVVTAQSFVVDVNGGPGANFTSITAAVAAVPDGAVLRVRPGNYAESVVVAAKSLTIAGDNGAIIVTPVGLPALHVLGLGPAQDFVVRGMGMFTAANTTAEVRLEQNQGLVFVDSMNGLTPMRLHASNCDALLVSRCRLTDPALPAAVLDTCRAVFDECPMGPVVQIGGDLQLAGCGIVGHQNLLGVGGTALTMQGGVLRLLATQLSAGFSIATPGLAIGGTGSVRRTPDTALQGASPPVAAGITMITATMPRAATSWITGPIYSVYASGTAGDLAFLVGSVRALPQHLPGLDAVWLDAATAHVETAGVLTGGAFASWFTLPSSQAFTGLSVVWQLLSFAPNGALSVSNPTWLVLP